MLGEGRRRRIIRTVTATAVAVAATAALGATPAGAADITVVAVDGQAPGIYGYRDCDGDVHGEESPSGTVFLVADAVPDVETAVAVSYSGSLADDLAYAPSTVVFEADPDWGDIAFVDFELDAVEEGDLTVTVEPGAGYVVGDPASYTFQVTRDPIVVGDCNADLTPGIGAAADQTIGVGDLPAQLDLFWGGGHVFDGQGTIRVGGAVLPDGGGLFFQEGGVFLLPEEYTTPVVGDLPPGLDLVRNTWRGGATTPGVSQFGVRLCLDTVGFTSLALEPAAAAAFGRDRAVFLDEVCEGTARVRITVEGAAAGPGNGPVGAPGQAPPATPVSAAARFTG